MNKQSKEGVNSFMCELTTAAWLKTGLTRIICTCIVTTCLHWDGTTHVLSQSLTARAFGDIGCDRSKIFLNQDRHFGVRLAGGAVGK